MFTGLEEGVNKDFKDRYRNVTTVLKEVRVEWIEGDGKGVGHEQQMEHLLLRE